MRPYRPRTARLFCSIESTPFVSISAILAAIFVLTGLLVGLPSGSGIGMDLAKVNHAVPMPGANREDALLIAVMKDGKVFFGTDQVTTDQLSLELRERISRRAQRTIYIRVDGRTRYAAVAEVLNSVRSAGVGQVSFLVDQRKTPALGL